MSKNKKNWISPPMSYKGSKQRELLQIKKYEPKNFKKFIDVFGGGGSVSLYYLSRTEIEVHYNDIDKTLVDMYEALQDEEKTREIIDEYGALLRTKEEFNDIINLKKKTLNPVTLMIYKTTACFRGITSASIPNLRCEKMGMKKSLKHLEVYPKAIKNMNITNNDFREVLKRFQYDSDAFIYLDPPYIGTKINDYLTKFVMKDLEEIFEIMNDPETKAKIMLNLDYTAYTRETHPNLYRGCYPVTLNSRNFNIAKKLYTRYHIVLCNYKN